MVGKEMRLPSWIEKNETKQPNKAILNEAHNRQITKNTHSTQHTQQHRNEHKQKINEEKDNNNIPTPLTGTPNTNLAVRFVPRR
jgi:hypothetical protein